MKDGLYIIYTNHIYTIYTTIIYTIYTTIICTIYTKRMQHIYCFNTVYIENIYRCKQDLYHLHILYLFYFIPFYTIFIYSIYTEYIMYRWTKQDGNHWFVLEKRFESWKQTLQRVSNNPTKLLLALNSSLPALRSFLPSAPPCPLLLLTLSSSFLLSSFDCRRRLLRLHRLPQAAAQTQPVKKFLGRSLGPL